jgi:hypothetical protein
MLHVNLFAYDYTGYGMAYDSGTFLQNSTIRVCASVGIVWKQHGIDPVMEEEHYHCID